jgi:hypothetical protein
MGKAKRKRNQEAPLIPPNLHDPLDALLRLFKYFENKGVIVGGVAASLLGRSRLTVDLDAVVLLSTDRLPTLIEAAAREGMVLRIKGAKAFALKNRVLLLTHKNSGVNIDISLGIISFETEMVERAQEYQISGLVVRLPTPEDLIIMKAVAYRAKDLEDIKSIADSHPDLDKVRIRYWVEQFGDALDFPRLWNEIEKLL